jgi:hypothetical protein
MAGFEFINVKQHRGKRGFGSRDICEWQTIHGCGRGKLAYAFCACLSQVASWESILSRSFQSKGSETKADAESLARWQSGRWSPIMSRAVTHSCFICIGDFRFRAHGRKLPHGRERDAGMIPAGSR